MCAATRFPEVFPVRKITTPVVIKALTKFFSVFGLPKEPFDPVTTEKKTLGAANTF